MSENKAAQRCLKERPPALFHTSKVSVLWYYLFCVTFSAVFHRSPLFAHLWLYSCGTLELPPNLPLSPPAQPSRTSYCRLATGRLLGQTATI